MMNTADPHRNPGWKGANVPTPPPTAPDGAFGVLRKPAMANLMKSIHPSEARLVQTTPTPPGASQSISQMQDLPKKVE